MSSAPCLHVARTLHMRCTYVARSLHTTPHRSCFSGVAIVLDDPRDVSPIGHAANLHLDLACPNFGIQEWSGFPETVQEVFPGCPQIRDGYAYLNEAPGI